MMILSTECLHSLAQEWTLDKELSQERDFRFYQGWLTLPVAFIGLFLNSFFVASVIRVVQEHRVSRKFYVLLLNRAAGDVLACLVSFAISGHVTFAENISNNAIQLMNTVFVGSFWSATTSYFSMGILKMYGYARPFDYRIHVTMRRCIWLIIFSWMVFALFVIFILTMTALSKLSSWNSHNYFLSWISRKAETCLTSVYKFRNILTAFVYFLTILFFLITVVMVRRARKASNFIHQMANNRRSVKAARRYFRFKLIKMTLNVATLAIFHLPYTIWALLLILSNDPCFYTNNYSQMQILMGIVRICLLIRITLDAIVQFATDRRIRCAFWALLRIKHENMTSVQSTCPTPKLSPSLRSVRSMAFIYAKKDATASLRSVKSQGFLTVERKDNGNGSCIQLEVAAQENGEVRLLLPK